MAKTTKLQNYFNDFLPMTYFEFRRGIHELSAKQAVVAELLRICCEEDDVKAIKLMFERTLGKPEKVIFIKKTFVRTLYPEAEQKALAPQDNTPDYRPTPFDDKVIIDEADAPGARLRKELDSIGEANRITPFEIIDEKDPHTVAEVVVANLYAIALKGNNVGAISLLFDYIDGAVADVIKLEGEDTILLENYSTVAPYEAIKGEDGVWYVETEAAA